MLPARSEAKLLKRERVKMKLICNVGSTKRLYAIMLQMADRVLMNDVEEKGALFQEEDDDEVYQHVMIRVKRTRTTRQYVHLSATKSVYVVYTTTTTIRWSAYSLGGLSRADMYSRETKVLVVSWQFVLSIPHDDSTVHFKATNHFEPLKKVYSIRKAWKSMEIIYELFESITRI